MDATKKEIRKACKEAYKYTAIRNPFGVWFVTLYNKKNEATFELNFDESFSTREKAWMWSLLEGIDSRREADGEARAV